VRAVDRALEILICFTPATPVLSLTQISEQIGMHKSTIHRLLGTLEQKQFVKRDPHTGLYQLGYRIVELASVALKEVGMHNITPFLEDLTNKCGETVDLAVLDGSSVIYLQVIESPQRVKIAASVGQRLPAHCTATGKAFLAYLPEERVMEIIAPGLHRYTDSTLIEKEQLFEALKRTRELGFAMSEHEYEPEINAVAAPLLTSDCIPLAAVAIAGPSYRLPYERMLELGNLLRTTTQLIAREIGAGEVFETMIKKAITNVSSTT